MDYSDGDDNSGDENYEEAAKTHRYLKWQWPEREGKVWMCKRERAHILYSLLQGTRWKQIFVKSFENIEAAEGNCFLGRFHHYNVCYIFHHYNKKNKCFIIKSFWVKISNMKLTVAE